MSYSLKDTPEKLSEIGSKIGRYRVVWFLILVAIVYGFIIFRISSLSSVQPTDDTLTAQSKSAVVPHIDPSLVDQLKQLQDNSVSVQTLFNQARNNPFHE